jgi:transketolase
MGARYLRLDAQPLTPVYSKETSSKVLEEGFSELLRGDKLCLVGTGFMTQKALKVAEELRQQGVQIGVVDFVKLSNFNQSLLMDTLKRYQQIITLEEGFKGKGGLDNFVQNFLIETGLAKERDIFSFGIPSRYGFSLGSREEIHTCYGIGEKQILERIKESL